MEGRETIGISVESAPEVSIRGMIGVIDGLTMNESGAIIRYNGKRYEF